MALASRESGILNWPLTNLLEVNVSRIPAVVLGAVLAATLVASPAQSGPSKDQPAEKPLTRAEAHRSAELGQKLYLAAILPTGAKYTIGRCEGGPKVWRCPMWLRASDTRCTAMVLVWKSRDGAIYAEDNRLRCRAR